MNQENPLENWEVLRLQSIVINIKDNDTISDIDKDIIIKLCTHRTANNNEKNLSIVEFFNERRVENLKRGLYRLGVK